MEALCEKQTNIFKLVYTESLDTPLNVKNSPSLLHGRKSPGVWESHEGEEMAAVSFSSELLL